jgi:hypothetical protein
MASAVDAARTVWFDDFAPFGRQQIPRKLVNSLPANLLVQGRVTLLEALPRSDYELLKAQEFTLPAQQIATTTVSKAAAESMLEVVSNSDSPTFSAIYATQSREQRVSLDATRQEGRPTSHASEPATIYLRTDRSGKVREAYCESSEHDRAQDDAAIARALTLKFRPLVIDGVAHQMEAPLLLPLRITIQPRDGR